MRLGPAPGTFPPLDHLLVRVLLLGLFLFLALLGLPSLAGAWIWTHTGVDSTGEVAGQYNSMALDPVTGRAHVSHHRFDSYEVGARNLRYSTHPFPRDGGPWTTVTVDPAPLTGFYSSMGLAVDGTPHIVYYASEFQDFKHAWYDSSAGYWRREFVEETGVVGQYCALAVGGGSLFASYYDGSTPGLKLATLRPEQEWSTEFVDTTATVGPYSSIAVQGGVHIAYYDLTHGDLKYAHRPYSTAPWTITCLDSIGDVGRYTSIAADNDPEALVIAYYDNTNGFLKVAALENDQWIVEVADASANTGKGSTIALDWKSRPNVLYYDVDDGDLRWAGKYRGTWIYDVVAQGGNVGRFSSIQYAEQTYPSLVYVDETEGALRYAYGKGDPTAVEEPEPPTPPFPALRATPNPTRWATTLALTLERRSPLKIQVFDVKGRLVRNLYSGELPAGDHGVTWDCRDESGRRVSAGLYLARVLSPDRRQHTRIVVLP